MLIAEGAKCWMKLKAGREDLFAFKKGIITSVKIDKVNVILEDENQQQESYALSILERSENNDGIWDDVVVMPILNEAEILNNLKMRYQMDCIYSYAGSTLISINPYKDIEAMFGIQSITRIQQSLTLKFNTFNLQQEQPHVFSLTALAFRNLILTKKGQNIVITGESGSGKTENALYSIQFLANISNKNEEEGISNKNEKESSIEEKIKSCNSILETFRNAKTIRNNNSSRIGKYAKLFVNLNNRRIQGGVIKTYSLDERRVCYSVEGESNYHIFYHLLSSNKELLKRVGLENKTVNDFEILRRINSAESVGDSNKIDEIINCFQVMQFSQRFVDSIFKFLGSILYLGNIKFSEEELSESIQCCEIQNYQELEIAAELLEISHDKLAHSLLFKTKVLSSGEVIESPQSAEVCLQNTKSFCIYLYNNLFNWIVNNLNQVIAPSKLIKQDDNNSIGVLDTFGFENLHNNSLEQLLRNYANEHLEQVYISQIFKKQQIIYSEDGLADYFKNLCYQDNVDMLDLFDSSNGLFGSLQSACLMLKSDQEYLADLNCLNENNQNTFLTFPNKEMFTLNHTQSSVTYLVNGFITKNINSCSNSLKNIVLQSSSNDNIKEIFSISVEEEEKLVGQKQSLNSLANSQYLAYKFEKEIKNLLDELHNSDIHFIRCLKPNESKQKDLLVEGCVLQQIQSLQIQNSIEMAKNAYPERKSFQDFFREYSVCDEQQQTSNDSFPSDAKLKEETQILVNKIAPEATNKQILFGASSVHFKAELKENMNLVKKNSTIKKDDPQNKKQCQPPHNNLIVTISKVEEVEQEKQPKLIEKQEYLINIIESTENNGKLDTNSVTSINEIYVPPPNEDEHKDPLLVYILSDNITQEQQIQLKHNQISPALDKLHQIKGITEEKQSSTKASSYLSFYETKLNIRRNFFIKVKTKEILTFKNAKIECDSLLPLPVNEVSIALNHFENLLHFINDTSSEGQALKIKTLLKYSIRGSVQLKNEILTQILKQLNQNKNKLYTQRLLQYVIVFTYSYKAEDHYIFNFIDFLLYDLKNQWIKQSSKIISYIEYVIPTLFKSTLYSEDRVLLFKRLPLTELKINALIFQHQIKIPISLAMGTFFEVDVDPWDTFNHLKLKTMRLLNINKERLVPDLFEFFEIQTSDNSVFEKLLYPQENVWDVLQTHEVQKKLLNSYNQNLRSENSKYTSFQLMFKPIFMFTVYPEDIIGINIIQSQIFFDIYIGKITIPSKEVSIQMIAQLMNIVTVENISQIFPLSFSTQGIEEIKSQIESEYQEKIKGKLTSLQSKYEYIQLAKNSVSLLGMELKVKYFLNQDLTGEDYSVVFSSTSISFINNVSNQVVHKYQYSEITHWNESNDQYYAIITKDGNKHLLQTQYALNIKYYINQAKYLLKKQAQLINDTLSSASN